MTEAIESRTVEPDAGNDQAPGEDHPIVHPRDVDSGPGAARTDRPLPTWFVTGLAAAVVWCATAGAVGVVALDGGWYSAYVVAGSATFASLVIAVAVSLRLGLRAHADHTAAVAAVALFLAFFAFAGVFHSEHLLSDRDPALYITNGRAIARTHELRPMTHFGAFRATEFGSPNGRYAPNFFPMLPVLLALGWSAGGDLGLLLVGPLLGALGVLACYALATRVLGPRWALLVALFLIVEPLQVWFARDAYSELVVQVVVVGGLWLFLEARARGRWGIAVVCGFVVATSALARIDALAIVSGALAAATVVWLQCDSDATPARARRVVLAFGLAIVAGTVYALRTAHDVAPGYIHALGTEYSQLVDAFHVAIVGAIAIVVFHRARPGFGRWLAGKRYLFAAAVAAATAVFVWAYFWRPDPVRDLPVFKTSADITEPLRIVWTNWHFSHSLHWFSAYFGLPGISAAFVGFVILASRARRGSGAAATVFLVAVPVAVLYIVRPSITPDLPWAMRRYVPVVIPGISIAVVVALETGWQVVRSARTWLVRIAAGVGLVAGVLVVTVPTTAAAIPFAQARAQHGAVAVVHDICRTAGDDSAVLVYGPGFIYIELAPAIVFFCGIPTARSPATDLTHLARAWHALGKRLLVAAASPDYVRQHAPGATVVAHYLVGDDHEPERVFERASQHYKPVPLEVWLLEIPPGTT